jgi:hypothetical protein
MGSSEVSRHLVDISILPREEEIATCAWFTISHHRIVRQEIAT